MMFLAVGYCVVLLVFLLATYGGLGIAASMHVVCYLCFDAIGLSDCRLLMLPCMCLLVCLLDSLLLLF